MSDEQVSPPNDYCSRCKRTGFELFFIEYKPGYGDGSIIANSVCRDCREQMRHIVASNITLAAAPAREDGVREAAVWLCSCVDKARRSGFGMEHEELLDLVEQVEEALVREQALAASAPVCVCGHAKADHAEKHGWECSEECTCLKYTPAPACKTCGDTKVVTKWKQRDKGTLRTSLDATIGPCPDCAKAS